MEEQEEVEVEEEQEEQKEVEEEEVEEREQEEAVCLWLCAVTIGEITAALTGAQSSHDPVQQTTFMLESGTFPNPEAVIQAAALTL